MIRPTVATRWLSFLTAVVISTPASAQTAQPDERKLGPANSSELGLVIATGNAKSTTFSFRDVFTQRWEIAELTWEAGWVRAASRDGNRTAIGTPATFVIVEPGTAVDSQRLFSKIHYRRDFSPRTDWFANFDAVRDEPSNINRQFVVAAGLGTTWRKSKRVTFRTGYGFSVTDEDLAVEGPNRFAGYRLTYGLKAGLTATAVLESEVTVDGSLDTMDDVRSDWLNSIRVAINEKVALKTSIRTLFRNLPALEALDLRTPGGVLIGKVDVMKEKIDTSITTALVITF